MGTTECFAESVGVEGGESVGVNIGISSCVSLRNRNCLVGVVCVS